MQKSAIVLMNVTSLKDLRQDRTGGQPPSLLWKL